jgi:hypothetical protein
VCVHVWRLLSLHTDNRTTERTNKRTYRHRTDFTNEFRGEGSKRGRRGEKKKKKRREEEEEAEKKKREEEGEESRRRITKGAIAISLLGNEE